MRLKPGSVNIFILIKKGKLDREKYKSIIAIKRSKKKVESKSTSNKKKIR